MPVDPTRRLAAVAVLATLAACASKPKFAGKPVVTKIALIPATEPFALTLENRNQVAQVIVPISSIAFTLDSKDKANRLNQRLAGSRPSTAPKLTLIVVEALRAAGYPVEVLDNLARDPEDPDDIDFAKIKTDAEAIVQLRVMEIGVYSSSLSPDYLPRVNVDGKIYIRARDDSVYDETLYYGADAKEGKPWAIVADRRYAYPTFDDVMGRADELRTVFEEATVALARLMARQMQDALAKQTLKAPALT